MENTGSDSLSKRFELENGFKKWIIYEVKQMECFDSWDTPQWHVEVVPVDRLREIRSKAVGQKDGNWISKGDESGKKGSLFLHLRRSSFFN